VRALSQSLIGRGSVMNNSRGKCHRTINRGVSYDYQEGSPLFLPSFHRPHDYSLIQWARGNVGLKPSAAVRPVRRCSYTPATESVLQRIHYARSVISRSSAALRRHRGKLFNQHMESKEDFFLKNHLAKIIHWAHRESLSRGVRNA